MALATPSLILVGSTRPAKVEAVREAVALVATIDARWAAAAVEARAIEAGTDRMPMSDAATLEGARARAKTLYRLARSAGREGMLCLGLEGGLSRLPSPVDGAPLRLIRTWVCATDGERWGVGAGPAVSLPDEVGAAVEAGRELGDVMDARAGVEVRGTRGAWGMLTRDLLGRRDAFRAAVLAALAPFYNPDEFGPLSPPG